MKSHAIIATHEAARLSKRLVNHWRHKFAIDQDGDQYTIHMVKDQEAVADVTLRPVEGGLYVLIDSIDDFDDKVKATTINHLERMGEGGLVVTWQAFD